MLYLWMRGGGQTTRTSRGVGGSRGFRGRGREEETPLLWFMSASDETARRPDWAAGHALTIRKTITPQTRIAAMGNTGQAWEVMEGWAGVEGGMSR